jgi:tripartite ATP-independent transporter DctM subunit
MLTGMPISIALGLTVLSFLFTMTDVPVQAVALKLFTGIEKFEIMAIPFFILAGNFLTHGGVARRMIEFATSMVGHWHGGLALSGVLACALFAAVSGSSPATVVAIGSILLPAMLKQGYPRPYIASLTAAAGSTAILIPPSIAFIVYSVLVPGVSLNALFVGGLIPGILAGLSLLVPAIWLCKRGGFGMADPNDVRPPLWQTFKEAIWGLAAPIVILGGMRSGAFTPTEAAVVAVFYGLFVGIFIYRTLDFQAVYKVLADSAEIAAVVMIIIALASVFAHAGSTVGAFDAAAKTLIAFTANETVMLLAIMVMLLIAGMLIDGVSIFLVFLPILLPIAKTYGWDLTWFGIIMTMNIAIGQFTPPMAVNLMVTCKVAGCSMESTVPWVIWFVLSMLLALLLVTFVPGIALFLPRWMGDL